MPDSPSRLNVQLAQILRKTFLVDPSTLPKEERISEMPFAAGFVPSQEVEQITWEVTTFQGSCADWLFIEIPSYQNSLCSETTMFCAKNTSLEGPPD